MKNLGQIMKQMQQLQSKANEVQAKLAETEITGAAGGGAVQITLNGKGDMRRVKIDPSAISGPGEVEMLEDLITAAFNDAKVKVEAFSQQEMAKLTAGLPLPPGMKLPF
jgi:DNA-binding YbaB/EbfC family protein